MTIPVNRKPRVFVYSIERDVSYSYVDLDTAILSNRHNAFVLSAGNSFVTLDFSRDYYGLSLSFTRPSPDFLNFYFEDWTHIDPEFIVKRAEELSGRSLRPRPSWMTPKRFVFRRGPVEGIHRYKPSKRSSYRHPKTIQELRRFNQDESDEDVIDYKVKLRRRRAKLPQLWDDLRASDWGHNNWKRQRKMQWKPKGQAD